MLKSTTDLQIAEWCKSIPNFGGVLSNDEFATTVPYNTRNVYVLNLENERQSGSHWICINLRKKEIYYVDSFGICPTLEVSIWIQRSCRKAFYSKVDLQAYNKSSCGQYATYFAFNLTKRPLQSVIVKDFTNDPLQNEKVIEKFMKTFSW